MRMWQVLCDGPKPGSDGDYTLRFADFHQVIDPHKDFILESKYGNNLERLVESQTHYTIMGNIKEVNNPESMKSTESNKPH
jgi:hypothetical protein